MTLLRNNFISIIFFITLLLALIILPGFFLIAVAAENKDGVMCSAKVRAAESSSSTRVNSTKLVKKDSVCRSIISKYELLYSIPKGLLAAISDVESKHSPWAVGDAGKGHYPETKREAIELVEELHTQGKTNIDVGCMQVNLHFHGKNFVSLEEAFNPETNIEYAAKLLKSLFIESGSWKTAVSYYHSRDKAHGTSYARLALNSWLKILVAKI